MKKLSPLTNRFSLLYFYLILIFLFLLFTRTDCNPESLNDPIQAYFIVQPEHGNTTTVFTFDASESDSYVGINFYYWDFNNDGTYDIMGDAEKIVTHQFLTEGTYTVELDVRNVNDELASFTRSIIVGNVTSCFNDFHKPCPDNPTIYYEGQTYKTVQIGDQCWFAENLNVGQMISSNDDDPSDNGKIEMFCYNNEAENCQKYGGIYNWFEAMNYSETPGAKGICPDGWHIPTQADWDELASSLGGYESAGRKMMSCEDDAWTIEDLATNESGFTAFPGGRFWVGDFDEIGWQTIYWTSEFSTLYNSEKAFYRGLNRNNEELIGFGTGDGGEPWLWHKWWGAYVRCVKNK